MRASLLTLLCSAAAAAAVAACGSSSSGSAASPPPASPEPSGTPTTSQPSPSPGAPSPGTPTPEPSTPSPQPDRFVDVERLDPDAECDALVPGNVPAPVTVTVSGSPGACGRGVSEGTGHVAAVATSGRGSEWSVFGPDGRAEQKFSITSDLWPQPEGWLGFQAFSSGSPAFATLLAFFADGTPRRSEPPQASGAPRVLNVAPDPHGGAAVALFEPSATGTCAGELRRFDATGAPTGGPGAVACAAAVGVSTAGEAMVLEPGAGGNLVRWFRADGTAAAPPAVDPSHVAGQLFPLLDGSLVIQQGLSYVRRFPHLATAGEPAPAWLAARSGQAFRFTMGNEGYAFFPGAAENSADCTQRVELVAPSGRRCARLTFRRDGIACRTGSIDQGWDGTVVQQTSLGACGWRFWPRLLGGR